MMIMLNLHSFRRLAVLFLGITILCLSTTADAIVEKQVDTDRTAAPMTSKVPSPPLREIPIDQAVDFLSERLQARIVIMGELPQRNVRLDTAGRSALDSLKSILKGSSYAIIYNDPSHSHTSLNHTHGDSEPVRMTVPAPSVHSERTETDPLSKSLASRIEKLEAQIENGEADRFLERWSKHKDPKYIYNHRAELDRLNQRLQHIDEEK